MTGALVPPPRLGALPLTALGIRTIEEVLQANEGRARFLVEGLIHATTTLVYGLSEAGKSWLMVDMLTAVAHGQPWLGQPLHGGPHRCMVLAADSAGEWEYAERLGSNLGNAVLLGEPPPVDPSAWAALTDSARSEGIGLVVVDNLYAWAGAVDINNNAEVARALECLKAVAKAGIAVVLVHHTNSGGRKPAGVHAIPAFFRHNLQVFRTNVRSHGNDTADADYRLTRDGGRVAHGAVRGKANESSTSGHTAPSPARPKTTARYQEAVAHLQQAPPGMGLRELGRYLEERMDSVGSEDAGFGLVKTLRAKGLWPAPRGTASASTGG